MFRSIAASVKFADVTSARSSSTIRHSRPDQLEVRRRRPGERHRTQQAGHLHGDERLPEKGGELRGRRVCEITPDTPFEHRRQQRQGNSAGFERMCQSIER